MTYNGRTDIKDYLLQFGIVANYNGWDRQERGMQLATCLIDEAREVLGSLPGWKTQDYAALKRALLHRFSPEGRESKFTVELWNKRCGKTESVAAFGHSLRKLSKEAYPGVAMHDQILVDLFVKGLPTREMRRHVHLARPPSLDDAIILGTTYQVFDAPAPDSGDGVRPRKPQAEAIGQVTVPDEGGTQVQKKNGKSNLEGSGNGTAITQQKLLDTMTEIKKRLDGMGTRPIPSQPPPRPGFRPQDGEKREPKSMPPRYVPPICYHCGQSGHIRPECPVLTQQLGQRPQQNQPDRKSVV
jgi:hypothetical protein